jgi:pSer/pThr/pTyr-binding forkhead associated (FHA) protein
MDLGSTNGTYVNGDPLKIREPKKLKPGFVIQIGKTEFTYLG